MKATKARGFGKQYVQLLWGYKGPQEEAGWTNETEAPYRYGHCVVHRVGWLRLAVVMGTWLERHTGPEQLHAELVRTNRQPDCDLTLLAGLLGADQYEDVVM